MGLLLPLLQASLLLMLLLRLPAASTNLDWQCSRIPFAASRDFSVKYVVPSFSAGGRVQAMAVYEDSKNSAVFVAIRNRLHVLGPDLQYMMFPQSRHSGSSHLPQQLKFTTSDSCDRIKDEFQLLQAQYHSLKLECDKLASEKSEMQRHYVMYYEMSYGLNIEMHKQAEIVKRLNGICAQVLPYLSQEHQQQVLGAIERAKQVTAPELNSIIRQQLQAHQLSQLQALALPLTPLPVGLQPPSLPAVSAGTGLLSLSALGSQTHLSKEDKNGHDGDTHQEDDGEKSD